MIAQPMIEQDAEADVVRPHDGRMDQSAETGRNRATAVPLPTELSMVA